MPQYHPDPEERAMQLRSLADLLCECEAGIARAQSELERLIAERDTLLRLVRPALPQSLRPGAAYTPNRAQLDGAA